MGGDACVGNGGGGSGDWVADGGDRVDVARAVDLAVVGRGLDGDCGSEDVRCTERDGLDLVGAFVSTFSVAENHDNMTGPEAVVEALRFGLNGVVVMVAMLVHSDVLRLSCCRCWSVRVSQDRVGTRGAMVCHVSHFCLLRYYQTCTHISKMHVLVITYTDIRFEDEWE